jgi:hypothetical protein
VQYLSDSCPWRPELFAHGRLLYRFPGSDAHRFSPKLAYALVETIAARPDPQAVLWDPFCGAGLILSLARLFFADAFKTIIASDINNTAVECCAQNLGLVSDGYWAQKRLRHLRGLQKMNAKSHRRWGDVATYLEELLPTIRHQKPTPPQLRTFRASAFDLPDTIEGNLHFVGDLPYGKSSHLHGGSIGDLFTALDTAYPAASMSFVMTREAAAELADTRWGAAVVFSPCRNGRSLARLESHTKFPSKKADGHPTA